jgi:hypothetical protein
MRPVDVPHRSANCSPHNQIRDGEPWHQRTKCHCARLAASKRGGQKRIADLSSHRSFREVSTKLKNEIFVSEFGKPSHYQHPESMSCMTVDDPLIDRIGG